MSSNNQNLSASKEYGSVNGICTQLGYPESDSMVSGTFSNLTIAFRKVFMGDRLALFPTTYKEETAQRCAADFLKKECRMFQTTPWRYPQDEDKLRDGIAKLMCIQQVKHILNKEYNNAIKKRDREALEALSAGSKPAKKRKPAPLDDTVHPSHTSKEPTIDLTQEPVTVRSNDEAFQPSIPTAPHKDRALLLSDLTSRQHNSIVVYQSTTARAQQRGDNMNRSSRPPVYTSKEAQGVSSRSVVTSNATAPSAHGPSKQPVLETPGLPSQQNNTPNIPKGNIAARTRSGDETSVSSRPPTQAGKDAQDKPSLPGVRSSESAPSSHTPSRTGGASSGSQCPTIVPAAPQNTQPEAPRLEFILENSRRVPDNAQAFPPLSAKDFGASTIEQFFRVFRERSGRGMECNKLEFAYKWGHTDTFEVLDTDSAASWAYKKDLVWDRFEHASLRPSETRKVFQLWVTGPDAARSRWM